MLTDRTSRLLFPTRLVTYRCQDEALNVALASLIIESSKTRPNERRGETLGWQSTNDFLDWSADTRKLASLLAHGVLSAFEENAGMQDVGLYAWANLFTRGVFFTPHTHGNSAWSGVYYVDAGDSDESVGGMLVFRDPRAGAAMVITESNYFDSGCTFKVKPKTGDLVIFPAWLLHWVTPYVSDRPRISVSFNAQ